MAKNTFNLGDYLKDSAVSKTDTAKEQIEYIDLDRIDPDPDNFYSLEGLDELAANIELVGLQQPLRVRPGPGDHVTVVSGHRRRAACLLIRDGGSKMFEHGVPCIVERGDTSKEMQELRLIYANSSTRVMTSAELSKQAERVEELLYKLKEQGVEFPGRMRDHVAAAVNASKTKLARLHAIRANLKPSLLAEFDAGRISEAVAYRISQEDEPIQKDLSEYPPAALRGLTEKTVDGMIGAIKARRKPVGADPQISPPTLHKAYVDSDGLKNYLEERAEEDEKYFEMLSDVADRFLLCIAGVPSRREGIEALKREHGKSHHGGSGDGKFCWFFNAEPKGLCLEPKRGPKILRTWTEVYDLLCTIAVARLLAKDYDGPPRAEGESAHRAERSRPGPSAPTEVSPTWMTGTPPKTGYYAARLEFYGKPIVSPRVLWWDEGLWYNAVGDDIRQHQIDKMIRVIGWWPLPEKEVTT
jgi:ParB-like chromosome segregation protein Spo0J